MTVPCWRMNGDHYCACFTWVAMDTLLRNAVLRCVFLCYCWDAINYLRQSTSHFWHSFLGLRFLYMPIHECKPVCGSWNLTDVDISIIQNYTIKAKVVNSFTVNISPTFQHASMAQVILTRIMPQPHMQAQLFSLRPMLAISQTSK